MGERERYVPGTFCWAELGTADPEASAAFYVGLFGWTATDLALAGDANATTFRLAGRDVCALHRHDPRQGPQGWLSYVSVDDADDVATRAAEAGAQVVRPALDVYDAARTAILQDPTGAVFGVWQPRSRIGATLVNDPGAMCLNQLNTSDTGVACQFYTQVFQWEIRSVGTEEQPYWGIFNGAALDGGMMPLPAQAGGRSHWLVYFATSDLAASVDTIGALGGQVVVAPMPVPGGRIAVAVDPQGAPFALFEGRLDP